MAQFAFPGQNHTEEPEWIVWLTVLLSLIAGWVLMTSITGQVQQITTNAGTISIPSSWATIREEGTVFSAIDRNASGSHVSMRQVPKADLIGALGPDTLETAASNWAVLRSNDLEGFRVLNIESVQLLQNGQIIRTVEGEEPTGPAAGATSAMLVEYAYLANPSESVGANVMPVLFHGIDTLVAKDTEFTVLSTAVDQSSNSQLNALHEKMLKSWVRP